MGKLGRIISVIGICGFCAAIGIVGYCFIGIHNNQYVRIHSAMKASGYEWRETYYEKTISGVDILVSFDFENHTAKKNQYTFDIGNDVSYFFGMPYIKAETLSRITNDAYTYTAGMLLHAEPISYGATDWLNNARLVAHAGGAVREMDDVGYYTNSKEALFQNYDLGHRVFEIDFAALAEGDNLACAHDWIQFGNNDGVAMTYSDWVNGATYGSPVTASRYTPMTADLLIKEMIVNQDMYVVTDTKLTEDDAADPIRILVAQAMAMDESVLSRIVPQVYNSKMYDAIMDIYPFESVILTTYTTEGTAEEFIDFVKSHDNIQVLTHATWDDRFTVEDHQKLHDAGKLVFIHTLNTYQELNSYRHQGADGAYTDMLTPEDYRVCEQYMDTDYCIEVE